MGDAQLNRIARDKNLASAIDIMCAKNPGDEEYKEQCEKYGNDITLALCSGSEASKLYKDLAKDLVKIHESDFECEETTTPTGQPTPPPMPSRDDNQPKITNADIATELSRDEIRKRAGLYLNTKTDEIVDKIS